jgi:hypothetical protein
MDQQKQNQNVRYDKMDRPRGLVAAKNFDEYRKGSSHGWGHREPRGDHQWEQQKDDDKVRGPLQTIV